MKFSEEDVEVVLQKYFFNWIFQANSPLDESVMPRFVCLCFVEFLAKRTW